MSYSRRLELTNAFIDPSFLPNRIPNRITEKTASAVHSEKKAGNRNRKNSYIRFMRVYARMRA